MFLGKPRATYVKWGLITAGVALMLTPLPLTGPLGLTLLLRGRRKPVEPPPIEPERIYAAPGHSEGPAWVG